MFPRVERLPGGSGVLEAGVAGVHAGLLDELPDPTEAKVREGLEGNLCRCTGYHNIVQSVLAAAKGASR